MTIGSHQSAIGKSQVHLTPKWIIDALGSFDLDPCAATVRPWDCASSNIVAACDGLSAEWFGRVWLNPPFDRRQVSRWIEKLAAHGNGIALIHARTETNWFEPVWRHADAMMFLADRVTFCKPDGSPATKFDRARGKDVKSDSGAPVVLVAFGGENERALRRSGIPGWIITHWQRIAA